MEERTGLSPERPPEASTVRGMRRTLSALCAARDSPRGAPCPAVAGCMQGWGFQVIEDETPVGQ